MVFNLEQAAAMTETAALVPMRGESVQQKRRGGAHQAAATRTRMRRCSLRKRRGAIIMMACLFVVVVACLLPVSESFRSSRHLHRQRRLPGGPEEERENEIPWNTENQTPWNTHMHSTYNHNSQQQTVGHRKKRKFKNYYTHISDLLFCLLCALGWTVWMLSSFVRSDVYRFSHDSVLIRGHVLKVMRTPEENDLGVPMYRAVIDYMVPTRLQQPPMNCTSPAAVVQAAHPSRDDDEEEDAIQIRKHFETSQPLQEGFANVEILVLPHEPTHSVLKDDWQQQLEENKQAMLAGDDECWRSPWFKRFSIFVAFLLVLASVFGGIQVVIRLRPSQRGLGWALICCGVPLLLPLAIATHKVLHAWQRMMDTSNPSQRGIVIRGSSHATSTHNSMVPQSLHELCVIDEGYGGCCDEDAAATTTIHTATNTTQDFKSIQTTVSETAAAGCYFIRLQPKSRINFPEQHNDESSSHSTVSSLSSNNDNMPQPPRDEDEQDSLVAGSYPVI